ncbi:MAG: hypothetical protein IIW34_04450 [Clostridia bacterium]|nr:hypothetical protein [Clostridia bacterium]
MEELAVRRRGSITDERGREIKLIYCLAVSRIKLEGFAAETYGVSVIADGGDMIESRTVHDVAGNITEAERLVDLLWEGGVTPVTLVDIVDDYIEN